ncbi:MAG: energy-coupling factor transporter transmembrane component T [Candidatus Borkfalkiaceae bacterium]|nr:energy-coupling factor transporter transmembrane component T [Clostridia bacterium]MDY6224073.1 energy-coupling factor transporter transmembrane component T [Christensenellaceae bacterium]
MKVTFGRYMPKNSFADKCDPRGKLLLLIAYIAAVFTAKNFLALAVVAAVLLVCAAASKTSIAQVLRSVKGVLFLLLFTVIVNLFFYKQGDVILHWGFIRITRQGVFATLFLGARLILLVCGSSLLTLTTSPVSLTDGLESLLTPLKWVRFPVHELALIMSIALRFIPILSDETSRIMSAQKARGADFETGGLIRRVKAVIPVLIPLLISAFRRADELGDAMDARCYSGSKVRTKYKKLRFTARDLAVLFTGAVMIAGVVLFRIYFAWNV